MFVRDVCVSQFRDARTKRGDTMNKNDVRDDQIIIRLSTHEHALRTFDDCVNVAIVNRDNARVRALHYINDTNDVFCIVDTTYNDIACDDATQFALIDDVLFIIDDTTNIDQSLYAQTLRNMIDTTRAFVDMCVRDRIAMREHTQTINALTRAYDDALCAFRVASHDFAINACASNYARVVNAMNDVQHARNARHDARERMLNARAIDTRDV